MLTNVIQIHTGVGNELSVKPDLTTCRGVQEIQAAKEGAFAGTGRSHHYDLLTGSDVVIHSAQYMIIIKYLV